MFHNKVNKNLQETDTDGTPIVRSSNHPTKISRTTRKNRISPKKIELEGKPSKPSDPSTPSDPSSSSIPSDDSTPSDNSNVRAPVTRPTKKSAQKKVRGVYEEETEGRTEDPSTPES